MYSDIPKELIKSPVFLSTITALSTWYIKNKNTLYDKRKSELYKIIRLNYYYSNEINGDHVSLSKIMKSINGISETFVMTESVIGLINSFIDAHNSQPIIPGYEKYQRLIRLELELAKQCHWISFLRKYKTQHSIEKIHTYVPRGTVEHNQRIFLVLQYLVEFYEKQVRPNNRVL